MANSATLVIFGRLGDMTGQRPIYLIGLSVFLLAIARHLRSLDVVALSES